MILKTQKPPAPATPWLPQANIIFLCLAKTAILASLLNFPTPSLDIGVMALTHARTPLVHRCFFPRQIKSISPFSYHRRVFAPFAFQPSRSVSISKPLFLSRTICDNSIDAMSSLPDTKNASRDENKNLSQNGSIDSRIQQWTNYEKLVRKLYMTNLFNPVKLGLDNMHRLHESLGSPMDQPNIKIIHVAGSNGKGSVALKTANTLQLANYRVGLFVSPHISSFRERIQINGTPISETHVEKYLQQVFDICEEQIIPATFFEVTTALAFLVFAEEKVDVVVLETGLGGRLDATNVVRHPALSIITSIGLEHTRILGDTIEKIALEKGGIIKEGCPVLVGNNVPKDVLRECAKEKKASEFLECADLLSPGYATIMEKLEGTGEFEDYDAENSNIVKAALTFLKPNLDRESSKGTFRELTPELMEEGVKIRPPCRFEEITIPTKLQSIDGDPPQKSIKVILDVAHNPQAMDYLLSKLRSHHPKAKKRIVVGMSADKDLKYCTEILLNNVSHPNQIHLVEASHPRAASISSILEANPKLFESHYVNQIDEVNEHGRDVSSVSTQVREALRLAAENNELLVICGSVFIMADAREELGIMEPRDSSVIAEVAGAGMRNSQENFGESKK